MHRARNDRERRRGWGGGRGWVGKGRKNRCRNLSTRYFTTFCFQSEGRRCRGITRHRALFDFYGVKSWWSVHEIALSADLFFSFFPSPLPSFLPRLYAILSRNRDASLGKWSFFDLFFRAGLSSTCPRFGKFKIVADVELKQFSHSKIFMVHEELNFQKVELVEQKKIRRWYRLSRTIFSLYYARTEPFDHRPSLWKQITF